MAVNYALILEQNKNKDNAELDKNELLILSSLEKALDEKIITTFNTDNKILFIDEFFFSPINKLKITYTRKQKLFETLFDRYRQNGWRITYIDAYCNNNACYRFESK